MQYLHKGYIYHVWVILIVGILLIRIFRNRNSIIEFYLLISVKYIKYTRIDALFTAIILVCTHFFIWIIIWLNKMNQTWLIFKVPLMSFMVNPLRIIWSMWAGICASVASFISICWRSLISIHLRAFSDSLKVNYI